MNLGLAAKLPLIALLAAPGALATEEWPKITEETPSHECADAYLLAKTMFESKASHVYAPLEIPKELDSDLVLGSRDLDISGGDALESTSDFEKIKQNDEIRSVYWEKQPASSARIAVREMSRGWRGDQYSLYLLDGGVGISGFLDALEKDRESNEFNRPIHEDWRPPLVFKERLEGSKWFVEIGQSWIELDDWHVYARSNDGYALVCTIKFRPETGVMPMLPDSVRRLTALLDGTIGPGNDEGTLQQTAMLRNEVRRVLANAALRPWALSESSDVYNSREEVGAGLKNWAVNEPRKRVYRQILRLYPSAQRDLMAYYRKEFKLPKAKAEKESVWVMDIIFRAHYMFHADSEHGRYDGVDTNPW